MTTRANRLGSVVRDPKRRERLLGMSAVQFSGSNGASDLIEEDLLVDELINWVEDEDFRHFSARDVYKPSRLSSGGRHWLGRNQPDALPDTGLAARGLSSLSQLRESSTPPRISSTSRRIGMDTGAQNMAPKSLPVNIPDWAKILGPEKQSHSAWTNEFFDDEDAEDEDKLPPHELLAKQYAGSQMITFSVFEGAGRTLKGRDLSRVRYAILRQTGFIDS